MKILKKQYIYIVLGFVLLTVSCIREEPMEAVELNRTQPTSYLELFNSFWDTMNDNYNYFSEEKENWDDIYREYSTNFKKLTTFNQANVNQQVLNEANLCLKYFADIVKKIRDRHFVLTVTLPFIRVSDKVLSVSLTSTTEYIYSKAIGFKILKGYKRGANPSIVRDIMEDKLVQNTKYDSPTLLSGFLKTDPSTMYIQLQKFDISHRINILPQLVILNPVKKGEIPEILFKEFRKLDPEESQKFKRLMDKVFDKESKKISDIEKSAQYKQYLVSKEKFKNTEDIESLIAVIEPFKLFIERVRHSNNADDIRDEISTDCYNYINNPNKSRESKITLYTIYTMFKAVLFSMYEESGIDKLSSIAISTDNIYSKLFNPLTKGKVKKIILDLRGNPGGYVLDARFFTERFVTKAAIWGYQRTKEGNGRFNYSPWIPMETKPNKGAIKQSVPIIVLIDRNSYSMSEVSSLMLRTQDKVKIMGENSGGATAGLGDNDSFNGGENGKNDYLEFRMPLMATKDAKGKVIEGIGVTPDLKIILPLEQIEAMLSAGNDLVFDAALKEIRKMN